MPHWRYGRPYGNIESNDPRPFTLYHRHQQLRTWIDQLPNKNGPTAILDHGANPGLVSHFTKQALIDIAHKIIQEKPHDERISAINKALESKQFNKLAKLCGVRVIQIAERDSQIITKPKKVNEFINTWSIEGLYEEGIGPVELGWGTHEKTLPDNALEHTAGPKNQICIRQRGIDTLVRSWVPSGDIIGMAIRHGEAYSISRYLTVYDGRKSGIPTNRILCILSFRRRNCIIV